jgi:hypothetical protein
MTTDRSFNAMCTAVVSANHAMKRLSASVLLAV